MGYDNSKEERLWRAALPADECLPAHPIKTFTNSEGEVGGLYSAKTRRGPLVRGRSKQLALMVVRSYEKRSANSFSTTS